jgi:phosphonate transport system substrate-binding protein
MKFVRGEKIAGLLAGWLLLVPALAAAERLKPLEIGVFPNLSARAVVAMYQPLRDFLEKSLGRPVQVYTAPDFRTFVERTRGGEYDVLVTAPHLARLAQIESGYIPLANYASPLRALVVVPGRARFSSLEDLHGRTVSVPDRLAVISMVGVQLLRDHGLSPETGLRLVYAKSHTNAALSVLREEADAAVIGSAPFNQLPEDVRAGLRVLAATEPVPNQFYLASRRLPPELVAAIGRSLEEFAVSPGGRRFMETNRFGGLKGTSEGDLKKMDPYAKEVRRLLGLHQ